LLRIAAANYLWQLSGTRARSEPVPPLDAAPELEAKLVSEAAAWRMCRMLNGEHRELLAEWFSLAARADRVLAPQWVPVVMDVVKQPELASVIPVLGRRAAWLAARNPEWKLRDSTASPSEERWSNGTLDERLAELAALRALDPAAARGWVEKTRGVDPPDAREAFVRVLMIGVSADDEPFLETALDDKRKAVRAAAAGCLARLPQSAYVRRSLERLEPLMVLDPVRSGLIGKLKKRRLQVQLPVTLDKATLRDGLDASPPASRKIGERAWWLVQMVSIAPPSHWTQRFTCDVETFIEAVEDTEYGSDLMSALTEAAIRHVDDVWLAALCRHFVSKNPSAEAADALDTTILKIVRAAPIASRATLLSKTHHSID
jgi:hypothetical protein